MTHDAIPTVRHMAEIDQADWLSTVTTQYQVTPCTWTVDEVDELMTHDDVLWMDTHRLCMYDGYLFH